MSRSKRTARARLLDLGITPRALLTATDAAAYLNVAPATFRNRVRRGLLPAPVPGLGRWSREALDRAIDGGQDGHDRIGEKLRAALKT